MNIDRKTFLQRLGFGAAGLVATRSLRAAPVAGPAAAPLPPYNPARDDEFWRAVRAQYPLQDNPLYLNTGGLGPAPQRVLDRAIATMRGLQEHSETGHALFEPARDATAKFLGASADEICFVRNATEGNSIIAGGLPLEPGDEVIFETHAHPGGSFPWLNQEKRRGIKVRLFEPDPASAEGNLARIRELITPRTRAIQVSHLTCTTGLLFPVKAIAELAHAHGAWFHIDGAQSAGMIPVNVAAIGCDSFATSGHKWIGAPHETGILYLRRDRLDQIALTEAGAYSGELARLPGQFTVTPAASRHEYGTRNAGLVVGVAEAIRFQEEVGRERIAAHGRELASLLQQELTGMRHITLLTPRADDLRASITTFRHARASAEKFFGYLWGQHQLRCRPVTEQGLEAIRVSTHMFNTRADCDRVVAAVFAAGRDL